MITIKEASQKAFEFVRESYDSEEFRQPLLEEVELSEDENTWFITLSFELLLQKENTMGLVNMVFQRQFKKFEIDAITGQVKSMKIRNINEPVSQ